jgi:hypothetical protein
MTISIVRKLMTGDSSVTAGSVRRPAEDPTTEGFAEVLWRAKTRYSVDEVRSFLMSPPFEDLAVHDGVLQHAARMGQLLAV